MFCFGLTWLLGFGTVRFGHHLQRVAHELVGRVHGLGERIQNRPKLLWWLDQTRRSRCGLLWSAALLASSESVHPGPQLRDWSICSCFACLFLWCNSDSILNLRRLQRHSIKLGRGLERLGGLSSTALLPHTTCHTLCLSRVMSGYVAREINTLCVLCHCGRPLKTIKFLAVRIKLSSTLGPSARDYVMRTLRQFPDERCTFAA